jgi:PAS domain S-box-containing protein
MAASMQDALTPESFARVQAVLREWLTEAQSGSEGRSDVIELDQRCKDGSIVHTEIVAVYARGPDGSTEVIGVTRDITARKAAEAALLESEERFRRLFRQHSAVKLVMDSQSGQILDANDAAAEFYGWSVQELCRMNIAQINTLPPELIAFELGTVSESKKGKRFEFRHRRADGSIRDVESFSNTIESGGKTYVYSIVHDVTERKRAQEEKEKLEAQNRRMQRTASLGRMAGAIAHNFNNQLQGVIGNLELVLTEGRGTRGQFEYEDCVREALNAAQQAANVSRLLLAYLGQAPMEFERVDLSEACTKNISMLRAFIPEDFELDLRFASTELTVYANAAHLQQVLTNLVANAWESYAARRGKISLRFSEAKADEIATKHRFPIDSTLQDSTYACIEVSDSGCGIAEKEIENIFDPFYSSKFTGRGMGLPVVLGVLRSHRGVVTVESTVGKGSTFRVYLPLACDPT